MKLRRLLVLILPLSISTVFAQSNDETPYVTKKFTNASLNTIEVQTSGGSIQVVGGQTKEYTVEMYVRPNNWNGKNKLSKEEVEDRLEDYDIFIGTEGNTVKATAKRKANLKWDSQRGISIAFKINTPINTATKLMTSGGSIKLASLKGNLDFTTSGGSLKLEDLEGDINGVTSGGSIAASNCRKNIKLTTSGGSIHVDKLDGTMKLTTSGGSIELNDLKGDIYAHTSGGSVKGGDIQGKLNAGTSGGSIRLSNIAGSVKAGTSAGSVDISMKSLGEYLELSTSAGSIHVNMPLDKGLDLNLKGNRVSIPLKNFDGSVEKDRVNGKMNGGGVQVRLSATSGNVYVNQ